MSHTSDHVHCTELPKIVDDGMNNNYGKWKTQSYHKLRDWHLLQYIEGESSTAPIILALYDEVSYHGLDANNAVATVHVPSNAAEHKLAIQNTEP
jgi:hypothetical protein